MWNFACPDWEDRLRAGRGLVPALPLDEAAAERAVRVFGMLRLADVPGNPEMADAAGPWFRDIVRALFGSMQGGQRQVRELFLLVPKKNAKTTNSALLMLTALLLNTRPRAKLILTGPTHDVAELAFSQAKGAIELDEELRALLHVREHLKKIVHRRSGAELQIMTFDPTVLTGQKPAAVLIDELHVSARMARADSAIRQLRGGLLANPEGFLMFVTTQSEEPPVGVMRAELNRARAIRDGRAVGSMLPVLYEFPPSMQRDQQAWRDPANWHMVTPNLGRSIALNRLVEEYGTAEGMGDAALRAWASQHLNVEIGVALGSDAWAGAEHWEAGGDAGVTLESLLDRSEVVTVGIDGGGLDDLLALAVIGRERGRGRWLHWARAWAHPIVLERRKGEAARLRDFAAAGELAIVKAIGEDVAEVADLVARIRASGRLPERHGVGLDPAGIGAIVDALAERGVDGDQIVGVPQGWRLNGAIKTLERKLAEGSFRHAAQFLMAWSVANARVEPKGNAVTITKQLAGAAKIDPLVATFCAADLMARNPAGARVSMYEAIAAQRAAGQGMGAPPLPAPARPATQRRAPFRAGAWMDDED